MSRLSSLEAGNELEKEIAFGYGLSELFMMHTKLTRMRTCIDCRPFSIKTAKDF